jgi:hypothetical protein
MEHVKRSDPGLRGIGVSPKEPKERGERAERRPQPTFEPQVHVIHEGNDAAAPMPKVKPKKGGSRSRSRSRSPKPRKPRASAAAVAVKKLLLSLPQRLLDSESHTRAARDWCDRVNAAMRTLAETRSTRPVDTGIADLARFLVDMLESRVTSNSISNSNSNSKEATRGNGSGNGSGSGRPSTSQSMMYTPVPV